LVQPCDGWEDDNEDEYLNTSYVLVQLLAKSSE